MNNANSEKFTGVLVGGTSLLIRCAEILLERGHQVTAVVSSDPQVTKWCVDRSLISHLPNYAAWETLETFDYLFSIVNEQILPVNIIQLAQKLAINYHDAPLPRYAGTHATSWAILTGETDYAVSWHIINDKVDAGDILLQSPVDISKTDTAFTLNTKCYEAAILSFQRLVGCLANNSIEQIKQDASQRTFFPKSKKPERGGLFSWNWTADRIASYVRALDFGNHPNGLASPKVLIGDKVFIVRRLRDH